MEEIQGVTPPLLSINVIFFFLYAQGTIAHHAYSYERASSAHEMNTEHVMCEKYYDALWQ